MEHQLREQVAVAVAMIFVHQLQHRREEVEEVARAVVAEQLARRKMGQQGRQIPEVEVAVVT